MLIYDFVIGFEVWLSMQRQTFDLLYEINDKLHLHDTWIKQLREVQV